MAAAPAFFLVFVLVPSDLLCCTSDSHRTVGNYQCLPGAPTEECRALEDTHCCCGGHDVLAASWFHSLNETVEPGTYKTP
jgi:hypothetical protein